MSRRAAMALGALGILSVLLGRPTAAADWNQWRGPGRDGLAPGFQVPTSWPGELKPQWKVAVGEGHSSPPICPDEMNLLVWLDAQGQTRPASDSGNGDRGAAAREVKASWFGFDREDATAALQAAIDSGAKKVVVDNRGSDWIVNRPITLTGNQEVVFEDGVVVRAMKERFRGIGDPLFRAREISHLTLRGIGKVRLIMNKEEYEKLTGRAGIMGARHVLNISRCKSVKVDNLFFEKAGGDGIYITGGSKDVLIDNVVCDGNHRLGLAVISAENLTIRNSRFINALGGSPQGGIDLEPNTNKERLVNIRIEKRVFDNNVKGAASVAHP